MILTRLEFPSTFAENVLSPSKPGCWCFGCEANVHWMILVSLEFPRRPTVLPHAYRDYSVLV